MQRRQFLGWLSLGGLMAMTGSAAAHDTGLGADEFSAAPTWIGTAAARPAPDSDHLAGLSGRIVYISTDTGEVSYLKAGDSQWTGLPTKLVNYATADLPAEPVNGAIFRDANRGTPAWWDNDHYEYPNFVDDVKVTPTTVENSTTRTTVFDPDINANSLIQGRKYQIQLSGSFSTANTSDTFEVDVNLAGATDLAGVGNAPANVTNAPWWVQFEFSVRQDGVNGVLAPTTIGMFNSEAQQAATAHSTVSVDTTTVTELSVDILWDTANIDNSVTVDQAHLIQMG